MLSASIQQYIQNTIDAASEAERSAMRGRAERLLEEQAATRKLRSFNAWERRDRQVALEFLMRLDAMACGGGRLYRARRRVQLAFHWR